MEIIYFLPFMAAEWKVQGEEKPRLCGGLRSLQYHVGFVKNSNILKDYYVCGQYSYNIYNIYGVVIHYLTYSGNKFDQLCFICYHSDLYFGLRKIVIANYLENIKIGQHQKRYQPI